MLVYDNNKGCGTLKYQKKKKKKKEQEEKGRVKRKEKTNDISK